MTRAAAVEVVAPMAFSEGMDLVPVSRRPIVLSEGTVREVMSAPVPVRAWRDDASAARVSVVVVTYNNLVFTRMCLGTVLGNTDWPNFEVIVIDNASTDGTADYLREVARRNVGVRVVINGENRGFAAANNQASALATGDVLVLLNNDTMVPPGWLGGLVRHLEDESVGCVGAVTNRIGNEAEIEADYRTYGEMLRFAARHAEAHRGERFEIRTPCMFCLAMRRDVYGRVGPIDERYEVGMLEDDDYAMRMREAGYGVVCAEDVFVHHFGQASFGALFASGKYGEVIEANRRRFEEKWGVAWRPYAKRGKAGYGEMAERIRRAAEGVVPAGSIVAVVSKGDEGLLELGDGRVGWHFPRRGDGTYSGCYPADGDEAVARLKELRSAGAGFLLLPATAMWWLEHYASFGEHLRGRYAVALDEPGVCMIFDLRTSMPVDAAAERLRLESALRDAEAARRKAEAEAAEARRQLEAAQAELKLARQRREAMRAALATEQHARQLLETTVAAGYRQLVWRIREIVRNQTPADAVLLVVSKGDEELMRLPGRRAWHFPGGEGGEYSGYYPADGDAAIEHLESLRARGAQFIMFPNAAFWWLEHYKGLRQHLERYGRVWDDERCVIYKLTEESAGTGNGGGSSSKLSRSLPGRRSGNGTRGGEATVEASPAAARRVEQPAVAAVSAYDVVCFPSIEWDFRRARPQQMASCFADAGHRVFYASHEFRPAGEAYVVREKRKNVYEVSLRGPKQNIYRQMLTEQAAGELLESLAALRRDFEIESAVCMVQLPFWWPAARRARSDYSWPVVYDLMDDHAGFSTIRPHTLEIEDELIASADLVVATAAPLEREARRRKAKKVVLVRNGCDFDHFSQASSEGPPSKSGRPVIGYFGAVADWFDSDLVADLAAKRPDWDFVLVGSTFTGDVSRLSKLPNVSLPGEKPYAEIPRWLAGFDVAIIPFKRLPLTEATNPIKAYEILAGGKPVVSVPLPEMAAMGPVVRLASDAAGFEREIEAALRDNGPAMVERRREFARQNTWQKRFEAMAAAVRELIPMACAAAADPGPRASETF